MVTKFLKVQKICSSLVPGPRLKPSPTTLNLDLYKPPLLIKLNSEHKMEPGALLLRRLTFLCRVLSGADVSGDASQRPLYSWSEHTLPVTGLWAGAGGAGAVLLSSSLDHTVKVGIILHQYGANACNHICSQRVLSV